MAGSSVIGALRVSLGLDSAQFQSGADSAEKRAYRLGENIGKALRSPIDAAVSLKGAIGGLAGAIALNELAGATQRAFDYADAIADLSDRTGASTKLIQEFRYAAQLSGSGVDVADEALGKFTRTLGLAQAGGDAQVKLFRELGVTSKDFDTAFRQTLDGLAKLPTIQQRNATALQIFGKSAGTLTGLLGEGSAGFSELAARANDLGVVLQDDIIRNAGQANDQLDTMKMILSAQFANTVAQNANSLVALAQGVGDLTSSLIKFMSSNPETALAIIGAIAGGRSGGLPGAALGAIAGYGAGTVIANNRDDANGDIQFRREKVLAARKNVRDAQAFRAGTGNRGISLGPATEELTKQYDLFKKARAALIADRRARRNGSTGGTLPTTGTAEGASAANKAAAEAKRAAEARKRAAEKAERDEARYQQQVGRARDDELQAQLDLTVNQTERVNLQQALLDNEHTARNEAIQSDRDLTGEQKKQLLILEAGTYSLRAQLLHRRDQEEIARLALDASRAENENQQDVLTAQSRIARTAKERGEIEAKLLDLQFDQLRAAEQFNLDNATRAGDAAGVTAAQNRLKTLGTVQSLAQERTRQDNLGPLGTYLNSLPRTADEVNEAFEAVATGGLQSVIDGISDIGSGAKSLKDVFSDVANDIIRSLLKIGLQKGITALFGSLLGAKTGTSALGLSTGFKTDANGLILSGARAKGGPVIGGKNYLVGEMGPEIFTAPSSGKIIANDDMQSGGRWIIEPSPYFDVRAAGAARPETQAMGVKAAAGGAQIAASDSARRARRRLG